MGNKTVHDFLIKLKSDNTYNLYLDGKIVAVKGSYENIAKEFCDVAKNAEELSRN
jgi:hypothetical protein